MNQNLRKALDRIKSGTYRKVKDTFKKGERYCILGALTKAYEDQTGKCLYDDDGDIDSTDGYDLPEEVANWYGFRSEKITVDGKNITSWNDDTDRTLPELAEMIESHADTLCIPDSKAIPKGAMPVPVFHKKAKVKV